jgi:carbonic anhydrase
MTYFPHNLDAPLECDAIVVTCIDFRFQRLFERWLKENLDHRYYDRVAYAGGIKQWDVIFPQIEFAAQVHNVRRVILINHEDCRAYGEAGTYDRHVRDLRQARARTLEKYPQLEVELYYARLAGYLERISAAAVARSTPH